MESPPHRSIKTTIIFYMLSFPFTIFITNAALARNGDCQFPAIFNFGDTNSDTGGMSATAPVMAIPPNGQTFFGKPAGRWSDGRLIVDFMATALGLPFVSAYLDLVGANFTHGANFATSRSTICLPVLSILPQGPVSPFDLDVQYSQFVQLRSRASIIQKQGGVYRNLMPTDDSFIKALFTYDMGQADLSEAFFRNLSMKEVITLIPEMIGNLTANIKKVYVDGGRSFWIHNTGPIGCMPNILDKFMGKLDCIGCLKPHNEVCQQFNQQLKEAVVQLRKEFPLAAFTYVDIYSVKLLLYTNPTRYGFIKTPLLVCCGIGGKYNYGEVLCGEEITILGKKKVVGACKNPSRYIQWDGHHLTEAANRFIFSQISRGAFSYPPTLLSKACNTWASSADPPIAKGAFPDPPKFETSH